MSSTGAAPVTVTDSSSAPTRISALTVAVKLAGKLEPFLSVGVEPGQGERHRVGAGTKIDDGVAALVVSK